VSLGAEKGISIQYFIKEPKEIIWRNGETMPPCNGLRESVMASPWQITLSLIAPLINRDIILDIFINIYILPFFV
jgi:hypothetical protein